MFHPGLKYKTCVSQEIVDHLEPVIKVSKSLTQRVKEGKLPSRKDLSMMSQLESLSYT